jgi:hypothetical protein
MTNSIIKFSPFVQLVLDSSLEPEWGSSVSTYLKVPCERGIFYFGTESNKMDYNEVSGIISETNYLPTAYTLDPNLRITDVELSLIKNAFIDKFQHIPECLPELNELFIENSTLIMPSLFYEIERGNIPGIDPSTKVLAPIKITVH